MGRIFVGVFLLVGTLGAAAPTDPELTNSDRTGPDVDAVETPTALPESAVEAAESGVPVGVEETVEAAPPPVGDAPVSLDDLEMMDDEIVVLEAFLIDTNSIKPPEVLAEDQAFETMRDLSLQGILPVVYAEEATFEQQDTHAIGADVTEPPLHGELVFKNDLSLEFFYIPDEGYIGPDEFRYRPYTYHQPKYESTGKMEKAVVEPEKVVHLTVHQLPRAIQTRTLRHDLSLERQVNILFVIDNSRSMAGEQKILATSFDRFIRGFQDQNLDFRIGVLTTDAVHVFQPAKRKHTAVFGAGHLQLTGDALIRKQALNAARTSGESTEGILYQPFLDNDTPELTARFAELVQVGTRGDPNETAIVPAMMSYVPKLSSGAIAHNTASFGEEPFFFQPEAFLSIVVVSDEDETVTWISPQRAEDGSVTSYRVKVGTEYLARTRKGKEAAEKFVNGFLYSVKSLKRDAAFRIDAVIHPRKGYLFNRLAEAGGGQVADIRRDFSESLIAIGESIAQQASRTFRMPGIPIDEVFFPNSIRVWINGLEVPGDPANGWTYDPDRKTIELHGTAGEASFGALVRIDYEVEYQP